MRRTVGEPAAPFRLPAIDGSTLDLATVSGRPFLLSFFRFAACPFCNLRLQELARRFDELTRAASDFMIVAIFDSPLDNLQRHANRHTPPFPVLADRDNTVYRAWGIEHSMLGVLKGMIFRMPTLLDATFGKGYFPWRIRGSMTTMPADFLIDRGGVIRVAHYGTDEGDHLPFAEILAFARSLPPSLS